MNVNKRSFGGNKTGRIILLLAAGCFAFSTVLPIKAWGFGNFIRIIAYNAGGMGRGGTCIAIGDDPSNLNFNPAIIGETESNALDINLLSIFKELDITYTGTNNTVYTSSDKDRIDLAPCISYAHNNKNSPWSWGFSLSVPDAVSTDYTIQSKYFGPVNAFSQILHIKFGPVVAYQVTPDLFIGTRLSLDHGSVDLRMPIGLTYIDLGECSAFGVSTSVGVLYKPTENLNIGLYYEAPTWMKDMESKNADGYLSIMTPGGRIDFSNLDVTLNNVQFSQNFGLGVAYMPSRSWRLSADVRYFNWHKHWKEIEVEYSGTGSAAMIAGNLPTTIIIPAHVSDQVTFGLGLEYFFEEIYSVSAGYHHAHDAMSDNYLLPFVPATMEHTLTCGFSVMPSKNIRFGISLMYGIWADPSATSYHGYDQSLEMQLGLPPHSLDSELNNATTDRTMRNIQLSLCVYW